MRFRLLAVLLSLCVPTTTVFAQDEALSPESGDTGDTGEMGGEATAEGDMAVPEADAGGTDKPASVGILLGYGLDFNEGDFNYWGLGFGLKGGYNLDAIYLGARFVYYLGESVETPLGDISVNIMELGIEGGYDVDVGGATLRPGLGLGLALAGGDGEGSDLYLAPGIGVMFDVSDNIFLGAEARLKMVFSDPDMGKGLILLANAGMRF